MKRRKRGEGGGLLMKGHMCQDVMDVYCVCQTLSKEQMQGRRISFLFFEFSIRRHAQNVHLIYCYFFEGAS